jgi:ligand-binding sensor domain-containing protein
MKKIILVFLTIVFGSGFAVSQEHWTLLNTSNSDIPSDRTISLGISSGDIVYIGTPGGLVDPSHVYEYNGTNWTDMDWFSEFNGMMSSPAGHLCIATGQGVFHYDGTDHTAFNDDNSNLTANDISCLDVGPDGTEYVGMTAAGLIFTGGLGIYDGSLWTVYNKGNSPMPVNNVISVLISQTGTLWVGSQDAGLLKKNGDNWELFDTDNSGIPGNRATHMAEATSGMLWASFLNGSIATYDGSDWNTINGDGGFPESIVTAMLFDNNGNLWIGFENDGLGTFDGENWIFYIALTSPLPDNNITGLALDSKGKIWISTQWGGLAIYDPDFGSGINDFLSPENIMVFPNPVNTNLNIRFKEISGTADLFIYNSMGQLVMQQEINGWDHQIDCSGLVSGIYTLKLESRKGNFSTTVPFLK